MKQQSTLARLALWPALAALALSLAIPASEAQAQRRDAVDLVELELARGDGRGRGQQLALHYTLGRRARPDVELHVSIDGARRDRDLVAVLEHRAGWVPLGRARRGASVMVRATDRAGRVLPMRLGRGLLVTAVELSSDVVVDRAVVEREWGGPPRRPGVPVGGRPVDDPRGPGLGAVAAACDSAFVGQSGESECLRLMRGVANADAVIAACDRAFVGEEGALACLRARPRPRAVAACDRAFVGEESSLRCLQSNAPPRVVAACDRMFTGDAAAFRCLDIVGRTRASDRDVDEAFEVCGRRVGERQELRCLEDVLGRRPRRRR